MTNVLYDALIGDRANAQTAFVTTPHGQAFSYEQFAAKAGQAAHGLQQLGVRPGDRVLVQAEKSIDQLALYLGTVRAGAVFVPLNTGYTANEVEYFLSDARPSVFICKPENSTGLAPIAEKSGVKLLTLSDDGKGSWFDFCGNTCSAVFANERSGSDLAAILYTSGTTGRSKGAMLSHDNLLSNAKSLSTAWAFSQDDVLLHTLPTYHSHGLFVAINTTMVSGASMIFLPRFDADDVVSRLKDATVLMGVPTHYVRLLKTAGLDKKSTGSIRLFTSGSAPLLAQTHKQFAERTGHRVLERYGLTETNMNTSNPYEGERRPGSVGVALPDVEVEVRGQDSGGLLAKGEIGSIEVRGPNVFAGYWQQPEKTNAEFRSDGFFITGDLGFYDQDGYLTIIGRSKDLIISGGLNVYPKEVEAVIDDIAGVVECAVFGVPHEDFGEGVLAVIVKHGDTIVTKQMITDWLATRLAKFKQPKEIIFVNELPRNAMGKVQKNVLRASHATIFKM